jgi:hypothetical protein
VEFTAGQVPSRAVTWERRSYGDRFLRGCEVAGCTMAAKAMREAMTL